MLRFSALVAVFSLLCGAASAQQPLSWSLTVTGDDKQAWATLPQALDQCAGAVLLNADPAMCRQVSAYLKTFASRVQGAPVVVPPPSQDKP